jgi:hypothetical protein
MGAVLNTLTVPESGLSAPSPSQPRTLPSAGFLRQRQAHWRGTLSFGTERCLPGLTGSHGIRML